MSDDLYDRDFFAWTEAQAAALRARRSGDNTIDYDNLAEEIEDVGKRDFRECQSYVRLIIEHMLKLEFVGPPEATAGYKRELRVFRRSLQDAVTPTIQNRLRARLGGLFTEAVDDLVDEGMLRDGAFVRARLSELSWDQIADIDWYPPSRVD